MVLPILFAALCAALAAVGPLTPRTALAGDRSDKIAAAFASLDTDHNGMLSRTEVASHPEQLITLLDADGDGTVSLDEFAGTTCGPGAGRPGVQARMMQIRKARFRELDRNGDGKLTPEELRTAQIPVILELRDVNCDGGITLDELQPGIGPSR